MLAGPRTLTWTMDPQVLVDAFRDAKLIGKDETLRLVERATRVGDGWAITVDLPATRKAADVIKNREALASALAVDEVQLIVERVRGNGGHAGRVSMWVADSDPYAALPLRTPLLAVQQWDAWRPVPFGRDARDRRIDLPLVWTSLLVGAIPRQGKTFAARLAAAGLILDPHTRLYVADFKAGKDWDAAAQVAHRFMSGDESAHVLALVGWLVELVAEVQGRFRRMRDLDDVTCPESKVTPAMSRDRGAEHADHGDLHRRGAGASGGPDTGRGGGQEAHGRRVRRRAADVAGQEGTGRGDRARARHATAGLARPSRPDCARCSGRGSRCG